MIVIMPLLRGEECGPAAMTVLLCPGGACNIVSKPSNWARIPSSWNGRIVCLSDHPYCVIIAVVSSAISLAVRGSVKRGGKLGFLSLQ